MVVAGWPISWRRLEQVPAWDGLGERAQLVELCGPGGPAVVFVHGAGGIGKSVIVSAVTADLGRRVITVDAGMVEPTPGSVLSVVAGQVDADISTLEELAAALAGEAVVVVLDPYERFGLVDDWVRNVLVPALPASAVTIIVGRNAPNAAGGPRPAGATSAPSWSSGR